MKPIDIIDADDDRLMIPFSVKMKGRKPLRFTVPRFDFIDEDTFADIKKQLAELDEDTVMDVRDRSRKMAVIMLTPFITPDQLEAVLKLRSGQLDDILLHWKELSGLTLGEFLASADSSTENTGALSKRTSSTAGGPDTTLAAV